MKIEKLSKCIYKINGKKYDTRRKTWTHRNVYSGLRKVLFAHIGITNPKLSASQVDDFTCRILNKNKAHFVLESGVLICG